MTDAAPAPLNLANTPAQLADPQADARTPQRLRHTLRFRQLQVLRSERITPHLIRITLTGDALQGFFSPGFDDHAKLLFPDPIRGVLDVPVIDADGKVQWGDGPKPPMRDYTPREYDAQANTLSFEFALHQAGPATAWAEQAQPGDVLAVGGPRGSFIVPMGFDGHVLIGDDTALPAVWRRLQELPAGKPVLVVLEVDGAADEVDLPTQAEARIHWVHREAANPQAATTPLLVQALQGLALPQGDVFAWVACESLQAKALRQHLVHERGLNPRWVRASGYWRKGAEATHESHDG